MIDVENYIHIQPEDYEEEFAVDEQLSEEVRDDLFYWLFHHQSSNSRQIVRLVQTLTKKKIRQPYIKFVEYINFYFLVKERYDAEEERIKDVINEIESEIDNRNSEIENYERNYRELESETEEMRDKEVELQDIIDMSKVEDEVDDAKYDLANLKKDIEYNEKQLEKIDGETNDKHTEIEELEDDMKRAEDYLSELENWNMSV